MPVHALPHPTALRKRHMLLRSSIKQPLPLSPPNTLIIHTPHPRITFIGHNSNGLRPPFIEPPCRSSFIRRTIPFLVSDEPLVRELDNHLCPRVWGHSKLFDGSFPIRRQVKTELLTFNELRCCGICFSDSLGSIWRYIPV